MNDGAQPRVEFPPVTLAVRLPDHQALALAQFIKRLCWSDARGCAASDNEAYDMMQALDKVRRALADAGYAPR